MSTRKKILFFFAIPSLLLAVFLIGPVLLHLAKTKILDTDELPKTPEGYADDVSRLNQTKVDSIVYIAKSKDEAIAQLRELLHFAKIHKIPVSIAGARHSMGGHTIAPGGIVIEMLPFNSISLDTLSNILTVGTGALWADIIPYLDTHKRAISVMQSDNAFSVGGSISVNCHGWQHNKSPISSTVLSFTLMNANGTIITCSRNENPELFSLALGGYGLFGIILEVKLRTAPNEVYTAHRVSMSSLKYLEYYAKYINTNENVKMVYGRLNVNKEDFLNEAMLNFFVLDHASKEIPSLAKANSSDLKRIVFLGTKDSDYGKKVRWESEKMVTKISVGEPFSRNQIMNESPLFYMNKSPGRTDILQEYFIPRRNFNAFIYSLQKILPNYKCDLLNITIRNVYKDEDTYLSYAREEVFGFVMFFNQLITPQAEEEMKRLTQELIDAALGLDGTYYLPYRLHSTQDQFLKAYPMAASFFEKKRAYDPDELFQNKFYLQYGKKQERIGR